MTPPHDVPIAYLPSRDKPARESAEQLRARIPGWGADLAAEDRPSYPKLQFQENLTGAHWDFPERQPEKWPRERSVEHAFLTPVFGTAQPPRGLSGAIRKFSYATYSEAPGGPPGGFVLAGRGGAGGGPPPAALPPPPAVPRLPGVSSKPGSSTKNTRRFLA